VPELLKRFSSKNKAVVSFCLGVMNQAIEEQHLNLAETNLKMIFKCTHELLSH
jgi:hypothetical protein